MRQPRPSASSPASAARADLRGARPALGSAGGLALPQRRRKPGDRVALMLRNGETALAMMLAIARIGAVWVPLNTQAVGDNLAYVLAHSEPRIVVAEPDLMPAIAACGADLRSGSDRRGRRAASEPASPSFALCRGCRLRRCPIRHHVHVRHDGPTEGRARLASHAAPRRRGCGAGLGCARRRAVRADDHGCGVRVRSASAPRTAADARDPIAVRCESLHGTAGPYLDPLPTRHRSSPCRRPNAAARSRGRRRRRRDWCRPAGSLPGPWWTSRPAGLSPIRGFEDSRLVIRDWQLAFDEARQY